MPHTQRYRGYTLEAINCGPSDWRAFVDLHGISDTPFGTPEDALRIARDFVDEAIADQAPRRRRTEHMLDGIERLPLEVWSGNVIPFPRRRVHRMEHPR